MAVAEIEITKPLPSEGLTEDTYKIEGAVKAFGAVGAPPFIYGVVKYKEWYKPDWAEEKDYLRAWPFPVTGSFSIEFKPEKEGEFEVEVIGTPAPLSLPVVGVWPSLGSSEPMKISVRKQVIDFTLGKPTVSPTEIGPGTEINITCPITSHCTETKTVTAKVKIYEGSALAGHGTLITTKTSPAFTINPEQSNEVVVTHTAIAGTIDRRDVEVELYIGGKLVKEDEWDDVYYVTPEKIDFNLTRPAASPAQVGSGDTITITCTITSKCTKTKTVTAKVKIYEGSALPGHGTLITTKPSSAFTINPEQSKEVVVTHTAIAGTIDRRDVEVELYIGGKLVKDDEWDDVYYVIPETIDFALDEPAASPAQVNAGDAVTITCPVTSRCTESKAVTAKVKIYEGSAMAGHGQLLDTKTVNFSIAPNQTHNVVVNRTTVQGTIDRRDVEVELYVGGKLVKEDEWDDVYFVIPETIDFTLTRPTASPAQANIGETVTISCQVTSNCSYSQTVNAKIKIYEGSAMAGHGQLLDTRTVNFSIAPNQTYNMAVSRTAVQGTIDRRDVEVELYVGGTLVKEDEWDDVYFVTPDVIDFNLTKPTASPPQVSPEATVTITCPVTSKCTKTKTVTAKVKIYEGSALPGHGTLLDTKTTSFSIAPNQTYNMAVSRTAVQGTIDRRDVEVELYVGGTLVKEDEWDDVYKVTPAGISFKISIWGIPSDFGSYQKWWAYYWDPGIGDFVSGGKWYNTTEKITFNNVQPGGWLAVFLMKDSTTSSQYSSPTFQPANNGSYVYDVQYGRIYG